MKKQIYDLINIVFAFLLLYVKDIQINSLSKIKVIENNFNKLIEYKLDDYESLKEINNIKTSYNFKCITSIKNYEINDFYKYISLFDNNCNTKKGDIVLNNKEMVGIVTEKIFGKIKVMLVTNPKFKLSIRVNNNYGTLKNKNGHLLVEDLLDINSVSPGDLVYTSGLTNMPDNILVGTVEKVDNDCIYVKQITKSQNNPYVIIIGDES